MKINHLLKIIYSCQVCQNEIEQKFGSNFPRNRKSKTEQRPKFASKKGDLKNRFFHLINQPFYYWTD